MARIVYLIVAVLALAGCNTDKECILVGELGTEINGELLIYPYKNVKSLEDSQKRTIKIEIINGEFSRQIDSTVVYRTGLLKVNDIRKRVQFFSEPGKITFSGTPEDLTIKGGKINQDYLQVKNSLGYEKYSELKYKKQLTDEQAQLVEQYENKLWELATEKPNSIPLSYFFHEKYWGSGLSQLEKVITSFSSDIYNSYYLNNLINRRDASIKSAIGQPAPFFELLSVEGEKISLGDYKGAYLLLDFWASWCIPCRKEIPNLKEVYNTFNGQGLQLLSISIDAKEEAWLKALKDENMPWKQARDIKDISKEYNVTAIPLILLISPTGKILAKKLHGESIWRELEKHGFKKHE